MISMKTFKKFQNIIYSSLPFPTFL